MLSLDYATRTACIPRRQRQLHAGRGPTVRVQVHNVALQYCFFNYVVSMIEINYDHKVALQYHFSSDRNLF